MLRILILSSLVLLLSCGESPRKAERAPAGAPIAVRTVAVSAADWPDTYEATGTVRARVTAVIAGKVMGYVRDVRVQAGDRVQAGQLLVTLDSRDLEANLRRAQAGYDEARSAQPEVESAVAAAQANLELAQVTFRRMQDLYSKKSISNQEFDESAARLKSARAAHEMALAKRAQLTASIAQAEEERRAAEVAHSYARLEAPFAGVVTVRSVDPGSLATPGAPLLTIERDGAYRLEASVEESRLASIHTGQPVTVSLDALGSPFQARVSEVLPAVDAASRAGTVKIDLPASPRVRSGLFGHALFALGTRRVLAVPSAAVAERGQLQSVMVAEGGTAQARLVTLGRRSGDQVEVLSGLSAGEAVIAPLPPGLTDGAKVEVRP